MSDLKERLRESICEAHSAGGFCQDCILHSAALARIEELDAKLATVDLGTLKSAETLLIAYSAHLTHQGHPGDGVTVMKRAAAIREIIEALEQNGAKP